jgi:hypothetical protein
MIQSYPGWFTNLCLLFWRGNRFTNNCRHFYRREHLFLVPGNNALDAVRSRGCFAVGNSVHSRFGCVTSFANLCEVISNNCGMCSEDEIYVVPDLFKQ